MVLSVFLGQKTPQSWLQRSYPAGRGQVTIEEITEEPDELQKAAAVVERWELTAHSTVSVQADTHSGCIGRRKRQGMGSGGRGALY